MKIKIIKAKYNDYWYSNHIGEEFNVNEYNTYDYQIVNTNSDHYHNYILKEDCEIIENKQEIINLEVIKQKENNKSNLYYNTNLQMYQIKLQDYKIKVVCNKCYRNGQVDEKCTQCGGKGVHNKTKQKWDVFKKLITIHKIDRDEDGELRYWEDKNCFFMEMDKLLHFGHRDALDECKRRNKEMDIYSVI